jgi:hypothetical protein
MYISAGKQVWSMIQSAMSLVGRWKDAQGRSMQFLIDGSMFIDGSLYMYKANGNKLFITANDMKLKAKYRFEGNTLYTTIKGNTNVWQRDIPTAPPVAPVSEPSAKTETIRSVPAAPSDDTEKTDAQQGEDMLKSEFGLVCENNLWVFYGRSTDELKASLSDPGISYDIIKNVWKQIKDPMLKFCIVVSGQVIVIFNTKPKPAGFVTGLTKEGVSTVIAAAIKDGAVCSIVNGIFVLSYNQ